MGLPQNLTDRAIGRIVGMILTRNVIFLSVSILCMMVVMPAAADVLALRPICRNRKATLAATAYLPQVKRLGADGKQNVGRQEDRGEETSGCAHSYRR
ncbi:MAG: hypothetical protein KatS3mg111_1853 [Pirellulaceae bacterium]|nr:MAG: hypothetical protein KatS3mg111_1853 [Pirellulaceae bacterium]